MRLLFVGQNPAYPNQDAWRAFEGTASGRRLNQWLYELGATEVTMINASPRLGRVTQSDVDPTIILGAILKYHPVRVVALGRFAHEALVRLSVEHFTLPHPSGRNRKLNDKEWVRAQLSMCRAWVSGVAPAGVDKVLVS